jgi:hypothetical protein
MVGGPPGSASTSRSQTTPRRCFFQGDGVERLGKRQQKAVMCDSRRRAKANQSMRYRKLSETVKTRKLDPFLGYKLVANVCCELVAVGAEMA